MNTDRTFRIAINGFGRIGRCIVRALQDHPASPRFELVAINDLADFTVLAHLLAFDSTHGRWTHSVHYDGSHLEIDGHRIPCFSRAELSTLPWASLKPDLVIEAAGKFKRCLSCFHISANGRTPVSTQSQGYFLAQGRGHGNIKKIHQESPVCPHPEVAVPRGISLIR